MDASLAHLEMIQSTINRLAGNSFSYKGWAVTISAGLIAFLLGKSDGFIIAGMYPIIAFWCLDAHSLALERAFRKLYDEARQGRVPEYAMNIAPFRNPVRDQLDAMLSTSLLVFYLSALVCIIVIAGVAK